METKINQMIFGALFFLCIFATFHFVYQSYKHSHSVEVHSRYTKKKPNIEE